MVAVPPMSLREEVNGAGRDPLWVNTALRASRLMSLTQAVYEPPVVPDGGAGAGAGAGSAGAGAGAGDFGADFREEAGRYGPRPARMRPVPGWSCGGRAHCGERW